MNKKDLIQSLDFILNKGFCIITIHRAWREFHKIKLYLTEEDEILIYKWMLELDPSYPDYNISTRNYSSKQFAYAIKQAKQRLLVRNPRGMRISSAYV